MSDAFVRKTEYGGFLPLELNNSGELFEKYEPYVMRFNSVKASLRHLIKTLRIKELFVPYYYCPSTTEAIRQTGVNVLFYHIGKSLLPMDVVDKKESAFLLVNYFGVKTEEIDRIAKQFNNAIVLIDRAHSFFDEPVFQRRVFNIYSAKKFFGVPDGSYIVGSVINARKPAFSFSSEYSGYLLTTYEEGTNKTYLAKKQSDKYIAEHHGEMSLLAYGLLRNVDYSKVRAVREANFVTLHNSLKNYNELSLPETCVPYHYPLYIPQIGRRIKKALIERRIYVPTLWNGPELLIEGNGFELGMKDDAVFLPVDQRYTKDDMLFIGEEVLIRSQI